jgi:hypothetical protein
MSPAPKEHTMPATADALIRPRRLPVTAAAAIACTLAAGAYAFAPTAGGRADQAPTSPPAAQIGRYHDIEANKARSMRALGGLSGPAVSLSRYRDLEANKARSMRALGEQRATR